MANFRAHYPGTVTVGKHCLLTVAGIGFCGLALAADTGDAPSSYGEASHEIEVPAPFLGDVEAEDNAPVFTDTALGDDEDGLDDEGGVFAFPVLVENGKSYDTNVFATNPLDVDVTLGGWVDFDGNGAFDDDELASATVPAGTVNEKFKLEWPNLVGVTTQFVGTTYARFRISSSSTAALAPTGEAIDGEVEDYTLPIQSDADGDETPDDVDLDDDNDGIPDSVEGEAVDTDSDGTPDRLDVDSDGDSIPDFIEAGETPAQPVDTDEDGTPDYLDLDSNNDGTPDSETVDENDSDGDGIADAVEGNEDADGDGIVNSLDLDSDNDTIVDSLEAGAGAEPVDTDTDGIADYLDLDSDNDGILDIREANENSVNVDSVDVDNNGRVDSEQLTGLNGFLDIAETESDSGIPIFAVVDTDADGIRDFRDLDSDGDSVFDILETSGTDTDGNGMLDSSVDLDGDGLIDGGNALPDGGAYPDVNEDGIADFQDINSDGSSSQDVDSEGSTVTDTGTSDSTTEETENVDSTGSTQESQTDNDGVIETGLSGGAGCSVSGGYNSLSSTRTFDIAMPGMFFLALMTFAMRRRRR